MCPACFANFALVAAGATSSSAAGAFALTKIFRQTATTNMENSKRQNVAENAKEGDKSDDET